MQQRLKHFGWGREGEGLTPAEEAFVLLWQYGNLPLIASVEAMLFITTSNIRCSSPSLVTTY